MSYSVSEWRTRSVDGLVFSVEDMEEAGFKINGELRNKAWKFVLEWPEYIYGDIEADVDPSQGIVEIEKFEPGEVHGSDYRDIIRPLMEKSMGFIEYVLVWECGDSVEVVRWANGKETVETII